MLYRFGEYTLDVSCRELRRGDVFSPLAPRVFDLLEYLIRNRERVVGKDDLIRTVWGGRIVSDAALTTRIYIARAAIGDTGSAQRMIKTLPRRGVRFVGSVEEIAEPADLAAAAITRVQRSVRSVAPADGPTIAVLLVAPDPSALIGEQLADDVRTELTRTRWLRVIARSAPSSGPEKPDGRLLHAAGVTYVLELRIQQLLRQYGVAVQLIQTASGRILWGAVRGVPPARTLRARDALAGGFGHQVATAIFQAECVRALCMRTGELGAWEAYHRGMWHMSCGDAGTIDHALWSFQHCTELDPTLAVGHSGLAWAWMMAASIYSRMPVANGCELASPLVQRAVSLDPSDPEARSRLALISFLGGEVGPAIDAADAVLAVAPRCASALGVRGAALIAAGRRAEGRRAMAAFLQLSPDDPVRPVRQTQVATSYYLDGDFERAAATAKQVTIRYPRHPYAYRWLAASLGQLGRKADARAALQALQDRFPSSFDMYVGGPPPPHCSAEYKPLLAGLRKAGWRD